MFFTRREFIITIGSATMGAIIQNFRVFKGETQMYGLISQMKTVQGERDKLVSILLKGTANMPGCLSYIIAKAQSNENIIWITEVWDNKDSHEASLSLPSVQQAIEQGKPLIAGFGERFETIPVGGTGLRSDY